MNFANRFWNGIYMAAQSFTFLVQYPQLLVYLSIAAPLYYVIQILFYNWPYVTLFGDEIVVLLRNSNFHASLVGFAYWTAYSIFLCASFLYVFIINILNAALMKHFLALTNKGEGNATVRTAFKSLKNSIGRIALWSLMFTIVSSLIRIMAMSDYQVAPPFSFRFIVAMICAAAWFFVTFFVLVIIINTKSKTVESLKKSWHIAQTMVVEIVGGQCWIALVAILCYAPLSVIAHALGYGTGSNIFLGWSLIIAFITVIVSYIILSAQTILKIQLYNDYTKK